MIRSFPFQSYQYFAVERSSSRPSIDTPRRKGGACVLTCPIYVYVDVEPRKRKHLRFSSWSK